MSLIPVTIEMFTQREDDETFQDFLLKNHEEIVNSKGGTEKILFSMEISRILGRVAVHERCIAEYERRPIDRRKYDLYNRTSLYVARRGIDIGTKMAYDRHEAGDDIPDVGYNYHMGWLLVQYSMNLLESNRYFAAMEAVDRAEMHLFDDWRLLAGSEYQDRFIEELKTVPDLKGVNFNISRKQKAQLLKTVFETMRDDLYYVILEKKIRILLKVYKQVPGYYKDMYAGYIYSLFLTITDAHRIDMIKGLAPAWKELISEYPEKPKDFLDVSNLSERDPDEEVTEESKRYIVWCNSAHLLLTFLDFVPSLETRVMYCCDDIHLETKDVDLSAMFEDVTETFAHCRFLMYSALTNDDPRLKTAYVLSPGSKRVYNQEVLMDMYPRLYSILDKTAHIVVKQFGIILGAKEGSKYRPQPSYSQIVKVLRERNMGNPFLMTLCEIYDEINPRSAYREYGDVPFYAMLPEAEHMDRMRHHIIHSGFCLTVEDTGNRSNVDVAYVRERDFSNHCCRMISLVKEAVMNTFLAIEYKNKNSSKRPN